MTQKVRDWPDGQLFHRPMRGQNSMPSHARQIDARDAWSVIHYIRQMQKVEPVAPAASRRPRRRLHRSLRRGSRASQAAPAPVAVTGGKS